MGEGYPPVEKLAFQRVELGPDGIVATVFNDGPDLVTVAQVQVDDAYWAFTAAPAPAMGLEQPRPPPRPRPPPAHNISGETVMEEVCVYVTFACAPCVRAM